MSTRAYKTCLPSGPHDATPPCRTLQRASLRMQALHCQLSVLYRRASPSLAVPGSDRASNVRPQELEVELEIPTRHRHEGVGDVSLIVRDSKPRRAAFRLAAQLAPRSS